MVYITENGANFRKKIADIIVGNCEKRKSNTKYFSETTQVDQPDPSVQQEQARGLELEQMFMMRKLERTSQASGNAGSIRK